MGKEFHLCCALQSPPRRDEFDKSYALARTHPCPLGERSRQRRNATLHTRDERKTLFELLFVNITHIVTRHTVRHSSSKSKEAKLRQASSPRVENLRERPETRVSAEHIVKMSVREEFTRARPKSRCPSKSINCTFGDANLKNPDERPAAATKEDVPLWKSRQKSHSRCKAFSQARRNARCRTEEACPALPNRR